MSGRGAGIARPGSDKMLTVLSSALTQCSGQAQAYGMCAKRLLPEVTCMGDLHGVIPLAWQCMAKTCTCHTVWSHVSIDLPHVRVGGLEWEFLEFQTLCMLTIFRLSGALALRSFLL